MNEGNELSEEKRGKKKKERNKGKQTVRHKDEGLERIFCGT